jgi:uncharacterized RDD family membrane protein YckC
MNSTLKAPIRCLILTLAGILLHAFPVLADEQNVPSHDLTITRSNSLPNVADSEAQESSGESAPPQAGLASETPGNGPQIAVSSQSSEMVSFGKDVELKKNETAQTIVVIGGSAKVHGNVDDAIVAIGGKVELSGNAKSVVAVLGSVDLLPGAKADETVAVIGNVRIAAGAETGQAVSVGGRVDVSEGGIVRGDKVSLGIPGLATPEWIQAWFRECALKLRPMAPQIGWLWVVAAVIFLFYFLIALLFRTPVQACVDEVLNRPASTFFIGLLTKMLLPVLLLVLMGTGIGLFVVPFVLVAVFVMGVFGKVAILESIGIGLGRAFGAQTLQRPLIAFFGGSVILLLLYMVPVLGFIVFVVSGVWGLGAAVMAGAARIRRETPRRPAPAATAGWPSTPVQSFSPLQGGAAVPGDSTSQAAGAAPNDPSQPPSFAAQPIPTPPVSELMTYPYATFWERMGAAFLDVILVAILGSFVGGTPWTFLVALAYFAGMWAWRGTTIGGIVLGLKVVRLDGQPVSFAPALVRGLAAAFSIVVLFLGFLWIAWDREKQGWHDKIAGTVVLKLPRGTPLVCA